MLSPAPKKSLNVAPRLLLCIAANTSHDRKFLYLCSHSCKATELPIIWSAAASGD